MKSSLKPFVILPILVALFFLLSCGKKDVSVDIDKDGIIGESDMELLKEKYNTECVDCPEDINGDSLVDSQDFNLLVANYGKTAKEVAKASIP
jgi:hypothetical protein